MKEFQSTFQTSRFYFAEFGGPLNPELVQSTAFSSLYSASNVLTLAEVDGGDGSGKGNFWLAKERKTRGSV